MSIDELKRKGKIKEVPLGRGIALTDANAGTNVEFAVVENPNPDVCHLPDSYEDKVACPKCHQGISPNANYCNFCGEEIVLYCPRCEQFIERARGQTWHECKSNIKIDKFNRAVKAAEQEIQLNKKGLQHCPSCWKVIPVSKENNCPYCKAHILTYDELTREEREFDGMISKIMGRT